MTDPEGQITRYSLSHEGKERGDALDHGADAGIIPFPLPPEAAIRQRTEQDARQAQLLHRMAGRQGLGLDAQQAAQELWTELSPGLLTVAFRILGNREEAEDVLQESMVRIWHRAATFQSTKGRPFLWAAMLTRGLALDALRSRERRRTREQRAYEDACGLRTAETECQDAAARDWMETALAKLNAKDESVVREIVLAGRTSVELAQEAGESDVTVRSRLRRALQRLREIISNERIYGKER